VAFLVRTLQELSTELFAHRRWFFRFEKVVRGRGRSKFKPGGYGLG
jgi:hypothetical protein